jgi:hypothetical protein
MLILLTLEHLVEGGATINIKNVILVVLITYGGLIDEQNFERFMCLGINGVFTFQGVRLGVTTLMNTQQTPFFIGIHWMAYIMNFVMQNLSSIPMVSKLKDLLQ